MERKKVLLMYSGGADSIYTAIKLIGEGYKVLLIHFDNGSSINALDPSNGGFELEKKYGKECIEFLGTVSIVHEFRDNEKQTANISFKTISELYGDITVSQLRCLNCRSAMYREAIKYCLLNNVHYIAEGARKCQLFAIEQPKMIDEYRSLCEEFNIELLTPMLESLNSEETANEQYARISSLYCIDRQKYPNPIPLPSAYTEDKCILGMPLESAVPEEQVDTAVEIFKKLIKQRYVDGLENLKKEPSQIIDKTSWKTVFK